MHVYIRYIIYLTSVRLVFPKLRISWWLSWSAEAAAKAVPGLHGGSRLQQLLHHRDVAVEGGLEERRLASATRWCPVISWFIYNQFVGKGEPLDWLFFVFSSKGNFSVTWVLVWRFRGFWEEYCSTGLMQAYVNVLWAWWANVRKVRSSTSAVRQQGGQVLSLPATVLFSSYIENCGHWRKWCLTTWQQ